MVVTQLINGSGHGFSLYAILVDGHCIVQEFIESLDEKYQKQIINLFQNVATTGLPKSIEKFRPVDDKIYELKTRSGVRILCFFSGRILRKSLVLTHGFMKPGEKVLKREIKKAQTWFTEYISGEINII